MQETMGTSNLPQPAFTAPVSAAPAATKSGAHYCGWGVVALFVGFFMFSIPLGAVAIRLGNLGVQHGAPTFGGIVRCLGWIEFVRGIVGVLALIGNAVPH